MNMNMDNFVNERLAEEVPGIYFPMGMTAEVVAKRYEVSRESQDEYAFDNRTDFIYEVGDVISYEDQQIAFPVCYGDDYPDIFSFQDYNGAINNGDYHVIFLEIVASH